MRRSGSRRAASRRGPDRRILGAAAALVVFGGIIGVTQISNAAETPSGAKTDKTVNGLEILANTCEDSTLPAHDGFQKGDRCVSTEFGEVAAAANNPSLLITKSPKSVAVNTPFTFTVSTRNLIRDRFLAAGQGGYYVESSVLQDGIERGHFHSSCRMLSTTKEAPAPEPVPAFFVATEDKKGGKTPDSVTINVPGLPTEGIAQCASWAGDGSHRIPMMERANQNPAFDTFRITVRAGGQQGGGQQGGGQQGGGQTGGGQTGGGQQGGGQTGGQQGGGQTGGNTGGQQGGNGGQTGGNTGGQNGDNTTKGDVKPNPTTKAPTKPPTKAPTKPASGDTSTNDDNTGANSDDNSSSSDDNSADDQSSNTNSDDSTPAETTTKKAVKPAAKKSTAAATTGDTTYDAGTSVKTADQAADSQVNAAAKKDEGKLARTGSNTVKVIGGGVILLIVGLIVLSLTRRRRPTSNNGW